MQCYCKTVGVFLNADSVVAHMDMIRLQFCFACTALEFFLGLAETKILILRYQEFFFFWNHSEKS